MKTLKSQPLVSVMILTNIHLSKLILSYADENDFFGLGNLTFISGTDPFDSGSQMCLDITIVDDELVEERERFVVCGVYKGVSEVTFWNNGCADTFIEDNDGIVTLGLIYTILLCFN